MPDNGAIKTAEKPVVRLTAEVGKSGLKQYGGIVVEEYDPDLRGIRGVKVYDEMRRSDPTIAVGLRAIAWMIQQVGWTVKPGGESAADKDAATFLESVREDMSHTWSKLIRDALTCLIFGWSMLEVVYKQRNSTDGNPASRHDDGRIGWRKFVLLGQESLFRWQFDDNGGIKALEQYVIYGDGATSGHTVVPIEKALLFRTEDEKDNPEGLSLLRACYLPWYMKKQIQEIEAIGIERDLTGVLIIYMPVGATADDKTKAQQLLEQFKADDMSGFVAPQFGPGEHERWRFEIINSPGSKSIDTDRIVQRYQLEIARNFMSQFLMLGQNAGSRALSEDQSDFFEAAIKAILTMIEETLNRFAVPPLFRYNDFGKLSGLPQFRAGRVNRADLQKFADGMGKLSTAGFVTPRSKDEQFIRQEFDLPELTDEEIAEEERAKAEAPAAPPPPPVAQKPEEETGQEAEKQASEELSILYGANQPRDELGRFAAGFGVAAGVNDAARGLKSSDVANLRAIVGGNPVPTVVAEHEIIQASKEKLAETFPANAERVAKSERDYASARDNRPSYAPGLTRSEGAKFTAMQSARQELRLHAGVMVMKQRGMDIPPANRLATSSTPKERLDFYKSGFTLATKQATEPDPDEIALPDPDDDEAWQEIERQSNERMKKSGVRQAANEPFIFAARRYDYAGEMTKHQTAFRTEMKGLASQLREGSIGLKAWEQRSAAAITGNTVDGYRLGIAQAQGIRPSQVKLTLEQRGSANKATVEQLKYFSEFRKQVAGKVAAGEELTSAVDARAALYGGATRAAMELAKVGADPDKMFRWVRRKDDSCETCLGMEGKVKTAKEWAAGGILPSRQVKCDGNCGCELRPA